MHTEQVGLLREHRKSEVLCASAADRACAHCWNTDLRRANGSVLSLQRIDTVKIFCKNTTLSCMCCGFCSNVYCDICLVSSTDK